MSALCLEELRRDQSCPRSETVFDKPAFELRVKWIMGADEWERWLIWRSGNHEWPICAMPDPDLTPNASKDNRHEP